MLVVWRGYGLLVPPIYAAALAGCLALGYAVVPAEDPEKLPDWLFALSFLIAGIVCWLLGQRLNSPPANPSARTARLVAYEPGECHDLFYLTVEYWGVLFGVVGAWMLLTSLI
jgi:hypothetical protein